MKYPPTECWAFAWSKEVPYITTITAYSRPSLICEVEKHMGVPWRKTYRQGGRAVKCQIVQKETP